MAYQKKDEATITNEVRIEELTKVYQLALIVENYCDNKKILKCLKKIVKYDAKKFSKLRFVQTEPTLNEVLKFLSDLKVVIKDLKKAKTAEDFNRAKTGMEMFIVTLELIVKPPKPAVPVTDIVSDGVNVVKEGVRTAFEKTKSKVKALREATAESLGKIKDSICNTKEND
ncbi:MAG: hypothetical protein J6V66_03335 [Clostridia bacterium]|nr:hypothetical protein [Clostridia bacterium]